MVDYTSTFRVAAVQAEPVWFDAARTVDKTVALIGEAAANGAQLIAFPEVWIPGYPYQIWVDSPMYGIANGYHTRYHQNSLTMDGPHVARLLQAAKDHEIAVVVGISEREGGSLYMTQLVIGSDGALVAKRRKLKPTHVERSVYGEGDGSDIAVYELPFARVGALNCWEHFQTLTKYAMFSQHEQLHVAGWPGMSLYQPHVHAFSAEAQVIATRMYAMEGQTFVACSTQVVTKAAQDFFCQTDEHRALIGYGGGFAAAGRRRRGRAVRRHRPGHDHHRQGCGRPGRALLPPRRVPAAVQPARQQGRQPGGGRTAGAVEPRTPGAHRDRPRPGAAGPGICCGG
jgi:predicted amidohydrolase